MNDVVIAGASGYGKVIADIIQKSGDRVMGFLDDNPKISDIFSGFPVLGTLNSYQNYIDKAVFMIAIGNADVRRKAAEKMKGARWYTAIHPSAAISGIGVSIADGTAVMANAVVNSGSVIGRHCIINSGAVVEHDNVIEDFVHISVGAKLAGSVSVGRAAWIGVGASVRNNVHICGECMIGAGAVAVRDIKEAGTYIGIPAKKKQMPEQ